MFTLLMFTLLMSCSRRLDLVNDGVMSNSAVKLLALEAQLEAQMNSIRKQEEMHLLWFNASSALTVFIQVKCEMSNVRIIFPIKLLRFESKCFKLRYYLGIHQHKRVGPSVLLK